VEPFEIEGDLHLECQEGSFASDAFILQDEVPEQNFVIQLVSAATNMHPFGRELDDLVAEHFGCDQEKRSGNRHIGMVRITIEKIEKD